MDTILQLDQPGYGIFSFTGLSVFLGLWFLFSALHPYCLAASRLGDLVGGVFKYTSPKHATNLHGLDSSAANAFGAAFLLQGEALFTGLALFALGVLSEVFGISSHFLQNFYPSKDITNLVSISGLLLFFVLGIIDNLDISWKSPVFGRISGFGNLLSYASPIVVFMTSGYDIVAPIALLGAGAAVRTSSVILIRGVRVYGFGALIWVPMMWAGWASITSAYAIAGPLCLLVLAFCGTPSFASLPFGSRREKQIASAELALPRSHALDTVPGIILSR